MAVVDANSEDSAAIGESLIDAVTGWNGASRIVQKLGAIHTGHRENGNLMKVTRSVTGPTEPATCCSQPPLIPLEPPACG